MQAAIRLGLTSLALAAGLILAAVATRAQTPPPGTGLATPALGIGLAGIADWSTQHPFLDVMKTARPWTATDARTGDTIPTAALREGGHLDAAGWPLSLPPDAQALETRVLTDQPAGATHLRGRYLLRYAGTGVLEVAGRARNIRHDPAAREIGFDYSPGAGSVVLRLRETDPADPLRAITLLHEDHRALHAAGALFTPLWLDRIADLRLLRFTHWQITNGSDQVAWAGRATPDDATYAWRGVPVEVIAGLANTVGADPWVSMPHAADDGYMRGFARYMRDHLDPKLRLHLEYSNALWDVALPQALWAAEAATGLWGAAAQADGWLQFAGMRSAQMADTWRAVFADAPDRLAVVASVPTLWPGMEAPMLEAPLAVAGGQIDAAPVSRLDAYAVTGHFGDELGTPDMGGTVAAWIAASRAVARARARAAETGARPGARPAEEGFALAFELAAETLRRGSHGALIGNLLPYHGAAAQRYGLDLVMSAGGPRIAGGGTGSRSAFLTAFSYSEEMGRLLTEAIGGWRAAGGTVFTAFVDVAPPSPSGRWGALRHLQDDSPRWQALMRANATPPRWHDPRPPGTFLHEAPRRTGAGGARP
jgi:hypothetical protein